MLPWSIESGFLILNYFYTSSFAQSGIILFDDQSPPPITLPALTVANQFYYFCKMIYYKH